MAMAWSNDCTNITGTLGSTCAMAARSSPSGAWPGAWRTKNVTSPTGCCAMGT